MENNFLVVYLKMMSDSQRDWRRICLAELLLKYMKNGKILDVGCGNGFFSNYFAINNYKVLGIDVEQELIDIARKKTDKFFNPPEFSIGTIQDISRECKMFDNVLLIDVLEHVEDDKSLIQDAFSLLNPAGRLIICVPACHFLFAKRDKKVGHWRRYSLRSLKNIFPPFSRVKLIRFWNFIGIFARIIENLLSIDGNIISTGNKTPFKTALVYFFKKWFLIFENNMQPLIGLSIIAVIQKDNKAYL